MTREELNAKYPWMADTELFQHDNGGGWVEHPERVEASAFVAGLVTGSARVEGSARVGGSARVEGSATVEGSAIVEGSARVGGSARVEGSAIVEGSATVGGFARVGGFAIVGGSARVTTPPWMISLGRHTVVKCDGDVICIGCHVNTLAGWLDKYEAVGRMEGYTKEEIARYGAALKMIEQLTAVPVAA